MSDSIAKAETAVNISGGEASVLDGDENEIHIGAGNRGRVYSKYSTTYNDNIKVVGVSDIIESRCNNIADQHNVLQENRFGHYREVFERPKMADAFISAIMTSQTTMWQTWSSRMA